MTNTHERSRLLPDGIAAEDSEDDNVVFWEDSSDPENPQNWPRGTAWRQIAIVSLLSFLIPLGATMFAPAVHQVMLEFSSTNEALSALIVSIYVLGWALGPLVLAPLSEVHGRMVIYTWSNWLYVLATVACALAPNLPALVVFRFLAGAVGSTPMAIGGGTISDLMGIQQRGLALSVYMFGSILGPTVGLVLGGSVADVLGWRWICWVSAGVYSLVAAAQLVFSSETYPSVILARKTKRLQEKTGNLALRSKLDDGLSSRQVLARAIIRPAKMTVLSPINAVLSLVSAYLNGLGFLLLTSAPVLFRVEYGFSPRQVGLAFIGYGVGTVAGLLSFTATSDRYIRRRAALGLLKAEDRLLPVVATGPLLAFGFLLFGWGAYFHAHWLVPVVATGVIGASTVLFFSAVIGYLIDCFTIYAASAIAANTVLRSVGGTLLPLAGRDLFDTLGWGGGSSVLALGAILLTPALVYLYVKGESIRHKHPVHL
ncbi:major facilitator superfamily domain-containing protein [Podospora didyma]|uniref:Major facilitator superfamily domain-containing protein n=1 Tax=Podospora didyma TaxID=330526 RepID=A0AAE0N2A5_9PEZI|nr:major facilitator superfamily domain-containing protein [Podospora didyma]